MSEHYHVRVTKDEHVFSAGHFITFNGDTCERLHGHNYRVAVDVYGPLDLNAYVVDFIALRDMLREITRQYDHYMLLPTRHPLIHVKVEGESIEAQFGDRRWVFPKGDCVLLPIANTTTELLAREIGLQLLERLRAKIGCQPARLRVELEEAPGQAATWDYRAEVPGGVAQTPGLA